MHWYARVIDRLAGGRAFSAIARRVAPRLDRFVYKVTGGRHLATPREIPTLLLTTVGRRSGLGRTVPLTFATVDGHRYLVGTSFGRGGQPAWVLNLLAEPRATAAYRGVTQEVLAVPVSPDEHARLWPAFDAATSAYREYRQWLDRPIHMFRLEDR